MLIFGGYPHTGVVYALDLTNMIWKCIDDVEYMRIGNTANLIGDSVYLLGGYDSFVKNYNDLQKYDIKK